MDLILCSYVVFRANHGQSEYHYTEQIVSTYWVSSAWCMPILQSNKLLHWIEWQDLIFKKGTFFWKLIWSNAYFQSMTILSFCTGSQWSLVHEQLSLIFKCCWISIQNGWISCECVYFLEQGSFLNIRSPLLFLWYLQFNRHYIHMSESTNTNTHRHTYMWLNMGQMFYPYCKINTPWTWWCMLLGKDDVDRLHKILEEDLSV